MSGTLGIQAVFGPLVAFSDDLITRHIQDFGAHTRPELAFLLSVVRAGDRVFDLGAHIGSFTIPLAQRVAPGGAVLAVEAVPETCAVLTANVALNGLAKNVEVRCTLIAPSADYEPVTERENTGGTFFRRSATAWKQPCATIDRLAGETFVPDVIKTDLEGFDSWALCSSQSVKDRRPVIYSEVLLTDLAGCGLTAADLSHFLRTLGYRFFRNAGDRNASHDRFQVVEIASLVDDRVFDVLAVHGEDPRIAAVT